MKQKSVKPVISWKKVFTLVFATVASTVIVSAVGLFAWMQTWKIFLFPDGNGLIQYPSSWSFEPAHLEPVGIGVIGELTYGQNKNGKGVRIVLVKEFVPPNVNVKTLAKRQIDAEVGYMNGKIVTEKLSVGGQDAYSVFFPDIKQYLIEVESNDTVYGLQIGSTMIGFSGLWEKLVTSLIIESVHFK